MSKTPAICPYAMIVPRTVSASKDNGSLPAGNMAIELLCVADGMQKDFERTALRFGLYAGLTARQSLNDHSRHTVPHKRRPSPHAHSRAAGDQNLLQGQRFLVVVAQAGTRA